MDKLFYILSFAIFLSCNKDNKEIIIDDEIKPYVDQFIVEASARGIKIDFSDTGLSLRFEDIFITAGGVCSELGNGNSGDHKIGISRSVWKRYLPQQRKRLIFHELGHCELNRPHDNAFLPNGEWKSIMRGDPIPEGAELLVNFTGLREQYYIDELFDSATPIPEWASKSFNYDGVVKTESILEKQIDAEVLLEKVVVDESRNFEIEINFQQTNGYGVAGFRWGPGSESEDMSIYFFEGNKLVLSSGEKIALDLYIKKFDKVISIVDHLYTVRKIGEVYYYFFDKEFIYQNSFFPMDIKTFNGFTNANVRVKYGKLALTYIQ